MRTLWLALALTALSPRFARAGACVPPAPSGGIVPADETTDVPLNARVWLPLTQSAPPDGLALVDANGDIVPSTTTVLRGHSVAVGVLAPIAPLAAQTSYVVRWTPPPSSNLSPTLATFTTGEAADISPPALPIETQRTQVHVDASSGEDPVREHDLIDVTLSHEPGVAVVDVGATTTLDPSTLAGVVTTLGADKLVLGPTAGACGEDDWNAQPSTVRYGAFDVAGNFSGWTPPTALEIAGCSIATHGNGVGLGGALLVLAFLARRRRWRPLA